MRFLLCRRRSEVAQARKGPEAQRPSEVAESETGGARAVKRLKNGASQYQYRKAEEHLQFTGYQVSPDMAGKLASVGTFCSVRAFFMADGDESEQFKSTA